MMSPVIADGPVGYLLFRGIDASAGGCMSNSRVSPSTVSTVDCEAPAQYAQLMAECHEEARGILKFWFVELTTKDWFRKSEALDTTIRQRFDECLQRALACELWEWRTSSGGRLAEILVLDQFSRNIHRDTPQAFQGDALALALSQQAVASGDLEQLPVAWQPFVIMPWMHSESVRIHDAAERLFERAGLEENLRYERRHADIVRRFGRYPHRNGILGRTSTPEEVAFLRQPGSSF